MNYTTYRAALANMLVVSDAAGLAVLDALLPVIIDDAEGRIYRDPTIDLLAIRNTDATQRTVTGQRNVPYPASIVVPETISLILPSAARPDSGNSQRVTLLRVSLDFINLTWPVTSDVETPTPFETYVALPQIPGTGVGAGYFVIAPTPDAEYICEVYGVARPAPLSIANADTILSDTYPELFLAASMVHACGSILKNWSSVADDPRSAVTWEQHYQSLRMTVIGESARQKSQGLSWTPSGPKPLANIPRSPSTEGQPPPAAGG